MRDEIFTGIKELIVSILAEEDTTVEEITPDSSVAEAGLNSLTYIKVLLVLESMYGIKFETEDMILERFETIKDLCEYVELKISQL